MSLNRIQHLLQAVEPAAQLVEPRVMRRVIRLDRRMQGFRLFSPHEFSYTIERDRLLAFVDVSELSIAPGSDLPRRVALLSRMDGEDLADADWPKLVRHYQRLLFHACVHLELENRIAKGLVEDDWAAVRRRQLGEVEFAEILDILTREDLLFPSPTDEEIYIEFAALALELKYFAPTELHRYFPAIRDWQSVEQIFAQDLDATALYERLDLTKQQEYVSPAAEIIPLHDSGFFSSPPAERVTLARFRQLQARAESAAAIGNQIKAALSHVRAAQRAPMGYEIEALDAGQLEIARFAQRLQKALQLDPAAAERWRAALRPLLSPAADGYWSDEARLLYDLQKVCTEQERGVLRLNLVDWIRTLGRRSIRRPLPLMQDALVIQHLRKARRRVAVVWISPEERTRLIALLDEVLPELEARSRDRLRPLIHGVFDEVGYVPHNVPETVARRKIVEELLDRVIERGYLTMADLRDAISRSDLKLADVTTMSELAFGDCVLQADRRFDSVLDGVYRRGAVYQRWPQTLSSLVFGTNFGRLLTRHLFIPFGGAYLILEFFHHMGKMFSGEDPHAVVMENEEFGAAEYVEIAAGHAPSLFIFEVLALGIWISLLIHKPAFRAWNIAFLKQSWKALRQVVVELPSNLLNSEYVQRMLNSKTFAVLRSYVLEPGLLVLMMSFFSWLMGSPWSWRLIREVFLGTALFLNSPVGRYLSERTFDLLLRTWQELRFHIFAAVVQWIMDAFDGIFVLLERIVYTVDEWLRFRSGDNRALQGVKLAGGVVWFFVSYVVVFVFTLLVEPQINPIKHFPVVTVSHKLILPAGPMFVRQLTPYVGRAQAQTLVWTTIWLIPGVFGFLVWELKENWRLYSANRKKVLGPDVIGHHGETMLRLLRAGFHSGTLPKAFAALRRGLRKGGDNLIQRKKAVIHHVEESVRNFVERELIFLLQERKLFEGVELKVLAVHAATNRIDVILSRDDDFENPARLTWEYFDGRLVGMVAPLGWMESIDGDDRQTLSYALQGLDQRAGIDLVRGPLPVTIEPPITWDEWTAYWDKSPIDAELASTS